jgi:hypothetical protein
MKRYLLPGLLAVTAVLLAFALYNRSTMQRASDAQLEAFYRERSIDQIAIFKREVVAIIVLKEDKRPAFWSPIKYYYNFSTADMFKYDLARRDVSGMKIYDFADHDMFELQKTLKPSLAVFEYR